jgi:hypothetical protein
MRCGVCDLAFNFLHILCIWGGAARGDKRLSLALGLEVSFGAQN